ncbi:MAG TPA: TetR/AcrR family transcriptional regulator [Candidatus Limivivens merdigallinarum]|uniref:TetR/AcrR family transcriptional regulator n=1 Tax=Candidatus Limivivens merdigallinarum TaxID=2840859 RepID=A0A9D0ZUT5_9FIRM|nr:TetR/AcrR family transcriptional regulator [Candidatus Limivivens merdigallinarum]
MARNKYPEVTVEKILDTAQQLFLEKGYDNTTIQDIVDHLGGLSKGAVYHHFKSKEEIIDAVSDRMFSVNNPFEKVKDRSDLNGLEKLREAIRLNQSDEAQNNIVVQSIPLTRNPRLLVEMIDSNRRILTPYYEELLEEGNRDGSIHTEYAREIAELIPLLTSLWLLPSVFPSDKEGMKRKFRFLGDMLDKMGVPLMDDSIYALVEEFFEKLPEEL